MDCQNFFDNICDDDLNKTTKNYRKWSVKNHPDKVPPSRREVQTELFKNAKNCYDTYIVKRTGDPNLSCSKHKKDIYGNCDPNEIIFRQEYYNPKAPSKPFVLELKRIDLAEIFGKQYMCMTANELYQHVFTRLCRYVKDNKESYLHMNEVVNQLIAVGSIDTNEDIIGAIKEYRTTCQIIFQVIPCMLEDVAVDISTLKVMSPLWFGKTFEELKREMSKKDPLNTYDSLCKMFKNKIAEQNKNKELIGSSHYSRTSLIDILKRGNITRDNGNKIENLSKGKLYRMVINKFLPSVCSWNGKELDYDTIVQILKALNQTDQIPQIELFNVAVKTKLCDDIIQQLVFAKRISEIIREL